jgi:hypothetical protein
MKILASIPQHMTRFAYISLLLLILLACFSCDDEKLESSKVRFAGTIQNADFSPAPNTKFQILIRTRPDFNSDTTIAVRLPVTTNMAGAYDTTVHTDGFPAVPFFTVAPIPDSIVSLEVAPCAAQPMYVQIPPNREAFMTARFGAAAFVKITFHKTDESSATVLSYTSCTQTLSTSMEKPDISHVVKLPYDAFPNQYPIFYTVFFGEFFAESRMAETLLQPYDTTHVLIEY